MKFRMSLRSIVAALIVSTPGLVVLGQSTPPAAPATPPAAEQPKLIHVLMTTGKGEIVIELNREKAPISVDNFLAYVDKKFYDGTIFHRIMVDFMIQGGGFDKDKQQKPTDKPIKLESGNGLSNKRGTIAMARTGVPDSGTSQFFINVVDNGDKLDRTPQSDGYAVFGKVVAGMSVVDAIRNVPTTYQGREKSLPTEIVLIEKLTRLSAEDAQKKIDAEKKAAAPAATPAPASN